MSAVGTQSGASGGAASLAVTAIIASVFFFIAIWFIWGPETTDIPRYEIRDIYSVEIDTHALREAMADPPTTVIAGLDLRCVSCHRLFKSADETPRILFQHQDLVLDHGLNDRCFNCHDPDRRNLLSLRGGERVPFDEAPRLCAKCHGTTYRDWQKGMHGRATGSWEHSSPARKQFKCSDCHDPHAPAYGPMSLLPGPVTLRMGERKGHEVARQVIEQNPLLHWVDTPHPDTDAPTSTMHEVVPDPDEEAPH